MTNIILDWSLFGYVKCSTDVETLIQMWETYFDYKLMVRNKEYLFIQIKIEQLLTIFIWTFSSFNRAIYCFCGEQK